MIVRPKTITRYKMFESPLKAQLKESGTLILLVLLSQKNPEKVPFQNQFIYCSSDLTIRMHFAIISLTFCAPLRYRENMTNVNAIETHT